MKITGKQFLLLLLPVVLVHCAGLGVTITGTDGTLYAMVVKAMVQSGNYTDLYVQGRDWLDKPHFPFWMTALSFSVFGIHTFAYKFPALLFTFYGAYCTYRFAYRLYHKYVARLAVLILLTAEHLVISSNDVRAEPYLTGLVIASTYQFYLVCTGGGTRPLITGCLFAACAVMTKGIFVLIPIGGAIAGGLAAHGQWKALLHPRWLAAAFLILAFITPELYSLYQQFDLHPEKTVFGQKGVSGIRFFFWDSQFGRFMNTGPIKGSGSPVFFLHTLLWAFLPWCTFLYVTLADQIRSSFRSSGRLREWFCFSGAVSGLLLFSLSRFQLPHYTNILFPFFAICTAGFLVGPTVPAGKRGPVVQAVHGLQWIIIAGMFLLPLVLASKVIFPGGALIFRYCMLVACITVYGLFTGGLRSGDPGRLIPLSLLASVALNLFLNLWFSPFLLHFQSGSEAAFWVNTHHPGTPLAHLSEGAEAYAFEFYADAPVAVCGKPAATPGLLYLSSEKIPLVTAAGYKVHILKSFSHFHISRLTRGFLNAATRQQHLRQYHIVRLAPL